ncbi:substrate-binding domain-containing protein [Clavibacter michiganensis]|uniref:LacI family transcriptional regulator n=1 Tax=Clavibacter michiganensis subsp. insidiosus TaxID=33014 RepID=A0A399S6G2_9MICO|nr:substrate-binding domain-containing protein [Clavibacter michiganensis]RII85484.1 LacI family transcriptional regulator [Clavibacter michiganensis subsp. insidiosus]RIJ37155.1 LacI family transcriptional regulator [Clavibacter michiganensis subsp. insidiosus]
MSPRIARHESALFLAVGHIFLTDAGRVSLTTVVQPGRLTGLAAVELLLERIEGRHERKRHLVGAELIVRSTTGPRL